MRILKTDIKNIIGIDDRVTNVYQIPMPYWRSGNKESGKPNSETGEKIVVFFGNDMTSNKVLSIDDDAYIAKTNECLDYIRIKFKNRALYYKPHPEEEKELSVLNLSGFNVIRERTTAELFLWKNRDRIGAVFSMGSSSSASAYNMGLNAYVFYRCFSNIYSTERMGSIAMLFSEMPEPFFINDFTQELIANERDIKKDSMLEGNLKDILSANSGKVWFICSFVGSIDILVLLAEFVKSLVPTRPRGLIINRSHRWNTMDTECLKDYFDEVVFVPRVFYSLRPVRLWQAIKTARRIKNLNIAPDDILIVATFPEFVENCLVSYYKDNLRLGFITHTYFNLQYNPQETILNGYEDFRFNRATWFYNKFFEPLLGLNRTIYAAYGDKKGFYTNRYQEPINRIFDEVYIMKTEAALNGLRAADNTK